MQSLTPIELASLLAAEGGGASAAAHDAGKPLLLDVREPWETALARIPAAGAPTLDIPMMQIPSRLGDIDRSRSVVCICHHGVRSAQVVAFLQQQGWPSVYNLTGGIDAWSRDVDAAVARY
jgi:rhodanese-related sulfurtransferase